MEEKQGYAAALDLFMSELLSEHLNVLDDSSKTAEPVLQSLKETSEVVRLIPMQRKFLIGNLWSVLSTLPQAAAALWVKR